MMFFYCYINVTIGSGNPNIGFDPTRFTLSFYIRKKSSDNKFEPKSFPVTLNFTHTDYSTYPATTSYGLGEATLFYANKIKDYASANCFESLIATKDEFIKADFADASLGGDLGSIIIQSNSCKLEAYQLYL